MQWFKDSIRKHVNFLTVYNLKYRLTDYAIIQDCDIIICANRVYNNVSKYIDHLAEIHNYRLLKVTNYRVSKLCFHIINLTNYLPII